MGCTFVTPSPDHLSLTVTCSMGGVAREEENGGRVVTQSSRGPLEQGLGCARGDAAAAVTSQEPPRERGGGVMWAEVTTSSLYWTISSCMEGFWGRVGITKQVSENVPREGDFWCRLEGGEGTSYGDI